MLIVILLLINYRLQYEGTLKYLRESVSYMNWDTKFNFAVHVRMYEG